MQQSCPPVTEFSANLVVVADHNVVGQGKDVEPIFAEPALPACHGAGSEALLPHQHGGDFALGDQDGSRLISHVVVIEHSHPGTLEAPVAQVAFPGAELDPHQALLFEGRDGDRGSILADVEAAHGVLGDASLLAVINCLLAGRQVIQPFRADQLGALQEDRNGWLELIFKDVGGTCNVSFVCRVKVWNSQITNQVNDRAPSVAGPVTFEMLDAALVVDRETGGVVDMLVHGKRTDKGFLVCLQDV